MDLTDADAQHLAAFADLVEASQRMSLERNLWRTLDTAILTGTHGPSQEGLQALREAAHQAEAGRRAHQDAPRLTLADMATRPTRPNPAGTMPATTRSEAPNHPVVTHSAEQEYR